MEVMFTNLANELGHHLVTVSFLTMPTMLRGLPPWNRRSRLNSLGDERLGEFFTVGEGRNG